MGILSIQQKLRYESPRVKMIHYQLDSSLELFLWVTRSERQIRPTMHTVSLTQAVSLLPVLHTGLVSQSKGIEPQLTRSALAQACKAQALMVQIYIRLC